LPLPEVLPHVIAFGGPQTDTPHELATRYREGTAEFRQANRAAEALPARPDKVAALVRGAHEQGRYARSSAAIFLRPTDHTAIVRPVGASTQLATMQAVSEKLTTPVQPVDPSREVVLAEVPLPAYGQRQYAVEVAVPGNAQEGEFIVAHVAQRVEGFVTGG